MKKIFVTILVGFSIHLSGYTQSKQVKLYLKQIGFNQLMLGYLKQAMTIAKTGLTTINDINHGDFSLHSDFFASLKKINPKIERLAKVADIIALQVNIVKNYHRDINRLKNSGQFSDAEIKYISSVFGKLLDDTNATLDILYNLVTADHFQMTDNERITKINSLYGSMLESYQFSCHFSSDAIVLSLLRMKEKNEVMQSKNWYGIK